jgi:hypothetical protein
MKSIILFFLIILFNQSMDDLDKYYDTINAYDLQIKGINLFSELNLFLEDFKNPDSIRINKNVYKLKQKSKILDLLHNSKNDIPQLFYPNMSFLVVDGNYVVPNLIDFRSKEIKLFLNKICFSQSYSILDFKNNFPLSYKNPVTEYSFFKIHKIHIGEAKLNSYFLTKWSIDDKDSRQLIELVFLDNQLSFIVFNNL